MANRGHWTDQGIDDYTLTVQVDCFCPPEFRGPFTVRVEGGEIVEATLEGTPIEESVDRRLLTFEGLFSFVERNAYADTIVVAYDAPMSGTPG